MIGVLDTHLLLSWVYLLLVSGVPAFQGHSDVAGYTPFSRLDSKNSTVGLLWTADSRIYTSRCFSGQCEEERSLYNHTDSITDMDVYFDAKGVYICDTLGQVYWINLAKNPPLIQPMNSSLTISELSVDWLSHQLYVSTNTSQIYRCDSKLRGCLSLHATPLPYTPSSLVADPYNGYLYWLTNTDILVKHDLATDANNVAADVTISSKVLTYSVAFDYYDLYSIYRYNDTDSEITLTYLNGDNERTHIPLNHSSNTTYSHLNCFHGDYCFWLESKTGSTHLLWYQRFTKKTSNISKVDYLTLTPTSILRQWHRQVQPIPVPDTPPTYADVYADSSTVEVRWEKPNILANLIETGNRVNSLWKTYYTDIFKFMQSEAAWSNWSYELNISNHDGSYIQIVSGVHAPLSYRFHHLNTSTQYKLYLVAYNDVKRSGARKAYVRTLSADPTIYMGTGSSMQTMNVFGGDVHTWHLSPSSPQQWLLCDIEVGEDNSLYAIAVPSTARQCTHKLGSALLCMDLTSVGSINVTHTIPEITAVSYDWIGKSLYLVEHQESISRRDISDIEYKETQTSKLRYDVGDITIDSLNAVLYWSSRMALYKCNIGPYGRCDGSTQRIYVLPKYSVLTGPVLDSLTNTLVWTKLNTTGLELFSLDLVSGLQSPSRSIQINSSEPMVVGEGRLYIVVQNLLVFIDLQTNGTATYPGVKATLIGYSSANSFPPLPGTNSSDVGRDLVHPEVDADSITITGVYDNFSISWSLVTDPPSSVSVFYILSIQSDNSSNVPYHQGYNLSNSFTPLITGVSYPQTTIHLSILPYTAWSTGDRVTKVLETPAAEPGIPENLRAYSISDGVSIYKIALRWDPPEFTGGTINSYNARLVPSKGSAVITRIVTVPEAIVLVEASTSYLISVRAETKAGFGNWSEVLTFSTADTVFHIPVISANPYTPETIEVKWEHTMSDVADFYNYTVKYVNAFHVDGLESVENPATYKHGFSMLERLNSSTPYTIQMVVCCISTDKSQWFGEDQCAKSNKVTARTYTKPSRLQVEGISSSQILVNWTSPTRDEVKKHIIKYKPLKSDGDYISAGSENTEPASTYKVTLGNLKSDTEYEIRLELTYAQFTYYIVPSAGEKFIVRTDLSLPGPVRVPSVECDDIYCEIEAEEDAQYQVYVYIRCDNNFELLIDDIDSDGTKHIDTPAGLPDDITTCSATSWSTNSVGKGPVSNSVKLKEKPKEETDLTPILAASVAAVVLALVAAVILYLYCRRRRKKQKRQGKVRYDAQMVSVDFSLYGSSERERARTPPISTLSHDLTLPYAMTDNALYDTEGLSEIRQSFSDEMSLLRYDRQKLLLTKFLGSGAFGEVYEGKARDIVTKDVTTLVAVKTLRSDASQSYKEEFVKEARLMSQFDNEYIVKLLGVCIDREPYYILIELMNQGDLVAFLRRSRPNKYRGGNLHLPDLLSICIDVATGCSYLEKLHFVHRDLAARNCLVNQNLNESSYRVKIGDFGLARDVYRNDYYRKEGEALLPVRWMSPEALVDGVFTTQSDIWAFGVLMWEVFTLAMQPYPARSNIDVLHYVTNSGTLDKPIRCPQLLFTTMLQCWSYASSERPTFREILRRLKLFESVHLTPKTLEVYDSSNRKITSESEFFAGSTSSGAGVSSAACESPVFPHEDFDLEKDTEEEAAVQQHYQFDDVPEQPTSNPNPLQSLMNFFRKKPPRHLLERVNSTPAEVSERQKNKYVRSDSTLSADRFSSRFTQAGVSPLSANIHNPGVPSLNRSKKIDNSLNVDISTNHSSLLSQVPELRIRSLSLPPVSDPSVSGESSNKVSANDTPVQYSTIAFNPAASSLGSSSQPGNGQPIQYATMAFSSADQLSVSSEESNQIPAQNSTMVSNTGTGTTNNHGVSNNGSVQYSSIAFNSDKGNFSKQKGIEGTGATVQYATMAFSSERDGPEERSVNNDGAEAVVQYSTMAFSNPDAVSLSDSIELGDETNDTLSTHNSLQSSISNDSIQPINHEDTAVQYAAMAYSTESPPPSETQPTDNSTTGNVQYSTINFNQGGKSTGSDVKSTSSSRQTLSTLSPSLCGSIERTPFGAKVKYTSEKFKHSPRLARSNFNIDCEPSSDNPNVYNNTL